MSESYRSPDPLRSPVRSLGAIASSHPESDREQHGTVRFVAARRVVSCRTRASGCARRSTAAIESAAAGAAQTMHHTGYDYGVTI